MENKIVFTKSNTFNSEYSCAVVKIGELTPVEGSDFLAKTNVFGVQIVVRKDQVKEGDTMIYAANETQLNEQFLSVNNLYEIGERQRNANREDVEALMKPYEPIKAEADKKRNEAKQIKSMMESWKAKSAKLQKQAKKKQKELETLEKDSEEYNKLVKVIEEMTTMSDNLIKKALAKTTDYTNLKNEVEALVKSGQHYVDEAKKLCGFFNKYGRVRCVTLKNTPSFGFLFAPKDLQKFDPSITNEEVESYVGQEFDTVNDVLFVQVYVPPVKEEKKRRNKTSKADKKIKFFDRMIDGEFYFHYDTDQLEKNIQSIKPDEIVDISVKLHGTSSIIGKLHVKQPLNIPFYKKAVNWFIDTTGLFKSARFIDTEVVYGPVFASRTVVKNKYINKSVGGGYYDKDLWTEYGEIIYPYLNEGMTVYGEIIGYVSDSEKMIQKMYDYGCDKGMNKIMFYRITATDEEGNKAEFTVPQVLEWTNLLIERMRECGDDNWTRIHPIDLLYHGTLEDLYPEVDTENHWNENVLEKLKADQDRLGMEMDEPLCKNEVPREGICIRIGDTRVCYKLKTTSFKLGEAIRMDNGDVDVEMEQGYGATGDEIS